MGLWRYLSVESWNRLAVDRRLPLSRIAGFDDWHECSVPMLWAAHASPGDPNFARSEELWARRMSLLDQFASCWFNSDRESFYMWELFVGRGQPGVAIRMTRMSFDD